MTALPDLSARNRAGEGAGEFCGLQSWWTAQPETLAAILQTYRNDTASVVIESTCGGRKLSHVISTEVPVPGGETAQPDSHSVTTPQAAHRTLDTHRAAFAAHGRQHAFGRVIALVAQPGVDFGNDQIIAFDPVRASTLVQSAPSLGGPLFEAHSADCQSQPALRTLVAGHFAVPRIGAPMWPASRARQR